MLRHFTPSKKGFVGILKIFTREHTPRNLLKIPHTAPLKKRTKNIILKTSRRREREKRCISIFLNDKIPKKIYPFFLGKKNKGEEKMHFFKAEKREKC